MGSCVPSNVEVIIIIVCSSHQWLVLQTSGGHGLEQCIGAHDPHSRMMLESKTLLRIRRGLVCLVPELESPS